MPADIPPANKALVDLRTYTLALRRMPDFLEVFDRLAMPVLLRHLGRPLGVWTSAVGPLNQVVHLWGYDNMGDLQRRHAARDRDADWPAYLQASAELITAQENRLILRAAMPSLGQA
jgi:hypothetical protein